MKIRAPHGSVGCATPDRVGVDHAAARRAPAERRRAARAGERDVRAFRLRRRAGVARASRGDGERERRRRAARARRARARAARACALIDRVDWPRKRRARRPRRHLEPGSLLGAAPRSAASAAASRERVERVARDAARRRRARRQATGGSAGDRLRAPPPPAVRARATGSEPQLGSDSAAPVRPRRSPARRAASRRAPRRAARPRRSTSAPRRAAAPGSPRRHLLERLGGRQVERGT